MDLCHPSPGFQEQRRFQELARALIRLPEPGEDSLDYLLPEARWQELCGGLPDQESWFMALSQTTGVYFFPSREWPPRLVRYLQRLGVRRLLEAGAGRGYLSAALAPLAAAAGVEFMAIDRGDGEFRAGLPVSPLVKPGDVFAVIRDFQPQAVIYAWPPPGQSVVELLTSPSLRYLLLVGEEEGGAAGAREDWERLPHKFSPFLGRFSRGRTGPEKHRVTIFCGGGRKGF
ncbi:MAG: hypothetical protein A2Z73_06660 [Deltaproteobacteria bacterium RBG_13_60_28]|nr:MAG: hypothetical protein A2Z73_06660 [Deltaproteobacteria bacterium RBG_13_60_28]